MIQFVFDLPRNHILFHMYKQSLDSNWFHRSAIWYKPFAICTGQNTRCVQFEYSAFLTVPFADSNLYHKIRCVRFKYIYIWGHPLYRQPPSDSSQQLPRLISILYIYIYITLTCAHSKETMNLASPSVFFVLALGLFFQGTHQISRNDFPSDFIFGAGTSAFQVRDESSI